MKYPYGLCHERTDVLRRTCKVPPEWKIVNPQQVTRILCPAHLRKVEVEFRRGHGYELKEYAKIIALPGAK